MTYEDHYSGLRPYGYLHRPDNIVDGIVEPLEGRKENRLEHQQDEIDSHTFEFRGGGTDHLDVDTSVHIRKKAS